MTEAFNDYMESSSKNDDKKALEAELQRVIDEGGDYSLMERTSGWQRLKKEILERTASLSRILVSELDEKKIYRTQGELLGIQSILNIVDAKIEDAEIAKKELEENNGTES